MTINSFRAYFTTTGSASEAEILINDPSGIVNISAAADKIMTDCYNLQGMKLNGINRQQSTGYKKVVIAGGKKYLMR